MGWKLKRTVQCAKCPWRTDVDPYDIPNGYDPEKHCALSDTIAAEGDLSGLGREMKVMACHETQDAHCVGWLVHQAGVGNNIPLRLSLLSCDNWKKIRTIGEQHQSFDDTLPQ